MTRTDFVFLLRGDSPIILHPFDTGDVFEDADQVAIQGRFGTGESLRDADSIRTELYARMEKGTRRHYLNKGYYLRLAAAAITFIAAYLFLSIVVRDPVPIIDELGLGVLAAAAVFFGSERRALSSQRHLGTVLSLRRAIDAVYFNESRVVDLVEAWRDEALALGPAAFYKTDAAKPVLGEEEKAEAAALCALLARRWKAAPVVAELYDAVIDGRVPGALLDKVARRLGDAECALALAYIRLIPLAVGVAD
ncbi:MAG: hypothetical protein KKA67_00845 [Spirochaetes bacterium]|nr:hypothetical protein [Spirochaetota bacterium]MBU1080335.1 hypothetical protein [Spirochaetota bacterium]